MNKLEVDETGTTVIMHKRMPDYALWTNDVETTSIWMNTLRDETGERVLREGMPELLDIYARFGIATTFFFTYYVASKFPEVVRMAVRNGHEVASHGKSHLRENGFDVMPFERQKRHLVETKKLLEDLSGQQIIGFRAPALRVNGDTARALVEAGYRIDSSIAPQRFDFFMSTGARKKLKWLTAPRKPYRTDPGNLFRKGEGPLVEVPLSALMFPYLGTTMRIFPGLTNLQRHAIHAESRRTGKPVVFDMHPNELIDESGEERTITRRTGNPVAYLLQDWLRSRLKAKNLGPAARQLYENQIAFFRNRGYRSVTVSDYCREMRLL